MSTLPIDNGKRIEELVAATTTKDTSQMLISTDGLTRKISLSELRNAFCGDDAISNLNNLFYSSEKINTLLDAISDELGEMNFDISNITDTLSGITDGQNSSISQLENLIENTKTQLEAADDDILDRTLNPSNDESLISKINTNTTNINNNTSDITDIKEILGSVTDITISSSAPSSTLPTGAIWLQYF